MVIAAIVFVATKRVRRDKPPRRRRVQLHKAGSDPKNLPLTMSDLAPSVSLLFAHPLQVFVRLLLLRRTAPGRPWPAHIPLTLHCHAKQGEGQASVVGVKDLGSITIDGMTNPTYGKPSGPGMENAHGSSSIYLADGDCRPATLDQHGFSAVHYLVADGNPQALQNLLEQDAKLYRKPRPHCPCVFTTNQHHPADTVASCIPNPAVEEHPPSRNMLHIESPSAAAVPSLSPQCPSESPPNDPAASALATWSPGDQTVPGARSAASGAPYAPLADALDGQGRSLLSWAVRLRQASMARVLLAHGADASHPDEHGRTPLILAAAMEPEDVDMVSVLLAAPDSNVNRADEDGMTPLMYASTAGSVTTVKFLLTAGADVCAKDKNGMTSLMLAVTRGHVEVVSDLCHAAVNEIDIKGWTALHWAASVGGVAACTKALLGSPTLRVSVVGNDGESCLHVAASSGNDRVVNALLSFSLHVQRQLLWLQDKQGHSALDYAQSAGEEKCATLIAEALERRSGEKPPLARLAHAGSGPQPMNVESDAGPNGPGPATEPPGRKGAKKQHELEERIERMDRENAHLASLIAARRAEVALLRSALSRKPPASSSAAEQLQAPAPGAHAYETPVPAAGRQERLYEVPVATRTANLEGGGAGPQYETLRRPADAAHHAPTEAWGETGGGIAQHLSTLEFQDNCAQQGRQLQGFSVGMAEVSL